MAFLNLNNGVLNLPTFLPDGTNGVVRGIDAGDMADVGIQGLVMNVFHLMQNPGTTTVQALGGVHRMSGWKRPIITDSGGFQIYSLISQKPGNGTISDRGMSVRAEAGRRKFHLTPEKSVQLQLSYGADVVMCLDECTHADAPRATQHAAVDRTVRWARRCKRAFEENLESRGIPESDRPRLFSVVQGGADLELRRRCVDGLLDIGFDGFGYGGWPLDAEGRLLDEVLAATRSFVPDQYPMHALGVGHPVSISACVDMGYGLFDSALPTRDARHGRLYQFAGVPEEMTLRPDGQWFQRLYIQDQRHIKSSRPLSDHCDCYTCGRYATGYLHHLFTSKESLYNRLATIHNLRFMSRLMDRLRGRTSTQA